MAQLPDTGFVKLKQIIGSKKEGIPPVIPVARSTWWKGIHEGRFPKPVKLGVKASAWRAEDIHKLIAEGIPK